MILFSCTKDEFDMHDPDVDEFVNIVRSGNYFNKLGYELPDFTINHIARLLQYSKDTSIINEFPANPVSSKYTTPKILNECLFWTIDGIRFANKYPSLEPCLTDTLKFSESEGYTRICVRLLIDIADLYLDWYEEYENKPSEILRTKNIFENTTYRW